MKAFRYLFATFVVFSTADAAHAAQVASAGFNDASGIHSDGVADSPYELGAIIGGQGAGEPGWNGPWGGGGNIVVVQDSVIFEGDGAAELLPLSGISRTLATQRTDVFRIRQRMRFDAGARLVVYNDQQANQGNAFQGPIWQAFADGNFRVIDGVGNACVVCAGEITGFTWSPDVWYDVMIEVDFPSQTWEFFVDGNKYNAPDPLGFRGTPTYLDRIRYQSEGSGGSAAFLDALVVSAIPEPSALALACLGLLGVVTFNRRRKMR